MYEGPEFRHLRYFVAIAEECNFGRASERLHVAQSSLSTQIRQLEDGLGAKLFVRGPAGTALTQAGRDFLAYAKQMLVLRDRAVQNASLIHSGVQIPLRFGYSPSSITSSFGKRSRVTENSSQKAALSRSANALGPFRPW